MSTTNLAAHQLLPWLSQINQVFLILPIFLNPMQTLTWRTLLLRGTIRATTVEKSPGMPTFMVIFKDWGLPRVTVHENLQECAFRISASLGSICSSTMAVWCQMEMGISKSSCHNFAVSKVISP